MAAESRAYSVSLANGVMWHIVADQATEWLCDEVAKLAGLRQAPRGGTPDIVLIGAMPGQGLDDCLSRARALVPAGTLPGSGWSSNRHRLLEFWSHPDVPFALGAVASRCDRMTDILQAQQVLYPVIVGEVRSGGMPVHAASFARDGTGALVAGRGNAGKSTCARRIPAPWKALADDEALIVPDHRGGYRFHPLPTWSQHLWGPSDRTWDIGQHRPLAALFFLEKSKADAVVPFPPWTAAAYLYQSGVEMFEKYEHYMDDADISAIRARMLANACRIARAVPGYGLKATLAGQFWEEMERAMGFT
jgi:SynChlorMet cassette protein ScmC